MYVLSLIDKTEEGAFAIVDSDGEKVLVLFEDEDDAERYLGFLEADDYPEMEIIEVNDKTAIKTCEMYNYSYIVIRPDELVIPPKDYALFSENKI